MSCFRKRGLSSCKTRKIGVEHRLLSSVIPILHSLPFYDREKFGTDSWEYLPNKIKSDTCQDCVFHSFPTARRIISPETCNAS